MTRRKLWLGRVGALAVAGGLMGMLASQSDLPGMSWAMACLAASLAFIVGHGLAFERRWSRWNARAVAAALAGRLDERPPPPRESVAVLSVALALALAGGVVLILGLIRWHSEPGAAADRGGR